MTTTPTEPTTKPATWADVYATAPRNLRQELVPRGFVTHVVRLTTGTLDAGDRWLHDVHELEAGEGRNVAIKKLRAKAMKAARRYSLLRVVGAHRLVNLAGLEARVVALCRAYNALPEARPMPWEKG